MYFFHKTKNSFSGEKVFKSVFKGFKHQAPPSQVLQMPQSTRVGSQLCPDSRTEWPAGLSGGVSQLKSHRPL